MTIRRTLRQQLYITIEVHDPDGRRRYYRRARAHSFVLQYLQHIRGLIGNVQQTGVADTGATSRTLQYTNAGANVRHLNLEPESGSTQGLVVGTGTTAVTILDTALAALIATGSGAGQLTYGTQTINAVAGAGSSRSFSMVRIFTNDSAGNIVVAECGAYVSSNDSGGTQRYFLAWRDVLGSTVTVVPAQTITVTYTLTISV